MEQPAKSTLVQQPGVYIVKLRWVIINLLGFYLLAAIGSGIVRDFYDDMVINHLVFEIIYYLLGFLYIKRILFRSNLNMQMLLRPSTAVEYRELIRYAVATIIVNLGMVHLTTFLLSFTGLLDVIKDLYNNYMLISISTESSLFRLGFIGLILIVVVPIFEEIIFRGFVFDRLQVKFGASKAVLLTAFGFALLHFPNIMGIFFLGLVLSLAYIKTGSLYVPVLIHALNNGVGFLFQFIGNSTQAVEQEAAGSDLVGMLLIGFILIGLGLPVIISFAKQNWP